MIVELDPISVLDLADGPVVIYTPAEGAAVVAITSSAGEDVGPPGSGQIGFASEAFPQIFAQSSSGQFTTFVQLIYSPTVEDPLLAGLTFGGKLAVPWVAGATHDDSTFLSPILGAGHYWTTANGGTSGATEPDWASAFGGTIDDNGITWEDNGPVPTTGSLTVAVLVEGTTVSSSGDSYADVDELARILKIRTPTPAQLVALQRVLSAAAFEIDHELDRDPEDALTPPFPALVVQVNLDRAEELWQQQEATLGFVGIGAESGPARVAIDTWAKHAKKLTPLKVNFGLA